MRLRALLAVSLAVAACKPPAVAKPPAPAPAESAPTAQAEVPVNVATAGAPAAPAAPAAGQAPAAKVDVAAAAVPAAVPARPVDPDVPQGEAAARDGALAAALAPYLEAHANSAAVLTPDGKQVLFVSNRDGLPQLYAADARNPAAPARRLVRSNERTGGAVPLADGTAALFLSDTGADENWSLFRVELASGQVRELTPGEALQRDAPVLAAGLPATAFYSARKLSETKSVLYRLELGAGEGRGKDSGKDSGKDGAEGAAAAAPQALFTDSVAGFLSDVTADGKGALWTRMRTASDQELLYVDLTSGSARQLYPLGGGRAVVNDARFSADGTRVLLTTDGGGEQGLLLALAAADGVEVARYAEAQPATASLEELEVAPKGGAVAVRVNAGNRSEVRLLDAATLKPRARVQLPLGTGGLERFTADGKRLTLTWSTPSQPQDAYAVDVASGRVAPLRREARKGLGTLAPVEVSLAEVPAHDGLSIPVNVYLPAGTAKSLGKAGAEARKLPVVVSYHGGPASSSAVRWNAATRFFLGQGYAWVEPNVRGSTGFGRAYEMADNGPHRLDAFQDVETAARWAAAQPWADPSRMVVFGGSYGGYTTLIALERSPDLWRAGVNLFGVVNMKTFLTGTSGLIRDIFRVEFGELGKDDAFLTSISPATEVARIADPLFVYAGANDPRVPRGESDQIVALLRERQVPVEYMVAGDEGHSLARRHNQLAAYSRIARFLETHVKALEGAQPSPAVAAPTPP
jgi:dienelactone hydrolase